MHCGRVLALAPCLLFSLQAPAPCVEAGFIRGDADQSGQLNLTDPIRVLSSLFLGASPPGCVDSADSNDDGWVNITDPIYSLSYLFNGGSVLPAPYPGCGSDPSEDQLGCLGFDAAACPPGARPISVNAPSEHYVILVYSEPVTTNMLDPDAFEITGPDGTPLEILEVLTDPYDDRVIILVTAPQEETEYTLAIQGPGGPIVFQGSDDAEPRVVTAISLGSTPQSGQVLLTFSEPISEGAVDIRFYQISNPNLRIRAAAFATIGQAATTVLLTTDPQRDQLYTVKVTNVKSRAGSFLVDPTRNLVTFWGIPPVDTTPPALLSAVPSSNTEVILSFSEPLWPGADDPRNFVITCFDPFTGSACPDLVITGARLTMLDTQIVLTTLAQSPALQYTVTVLNRCGSLPERDNCVQDLQENPIDPTQNTQGFTGLDRAQPFLSSAISLGPDPASPDTQALVLLRFSEPVLDGADEVSFYSIDAPDLDILTAELSDDGLTVLLTTENQENRTYTVKVTNVRSRAGGFHLDPERSSATFAGIPPEDTTPPQLASAVSTGTTGVLLSFSEPLLPGADDPRNFAISCETLDGSPCPGLVVMGASLGAFNTQITLQTTPQTAFVEYTVTVLDFCEEPQRSCVRDMQENPVDPAGDEASFIFEGAPAFSTELPRVVGAISTGNKTMVIQFSRPMSDSALDLANYFVVQVNVNPEVGFLSLVRRCVGGVNGDALCSPSGCPTGSTTPCDTPPPDSPDCLFCDCLDGLCEGARFLGPDRLAVELKTLSQNEVTYAITAVNVTDLAGNPLAPKTVGANGVVIDPRTAEFPGTPPGSADLSDSDGDGITDNIEHRGWLVRVELADGSIDERQVTSDAFNADSDGDGLGDLVELNLQSNPRKADTDADQIDDELEYNVLYSNQNDQDSDDDTITDSLEFEFFRTNAILADSDGDGFSDDEELFGLNRDPRIADLPEPGIQVGEVSLRIDERFTFVDEEGETRTEESSTSTTLEQQSSTQFTRSSEGVTTWSFRIAGSFGINGAGGNKWQPQILVEPSFGGEFVDSFQVSNETSIASSSAFESSVQKGLQVTGSRSATREVNGARIEAFVNLDNLSDVAFSLTNVEVTVSVLDSRDRQTLVPVATLIPNTTLITGEPAVYHIGPLDTSRGPILFASEQVFPKLVEDLMRDPRGLVFEIANYDLQDEFGRNFAYTSQIARDRSVGLVVDFDDGRVERSLMAAATIRNDAGDIIGGYGDFPGFGPRPAVPLSYLLEEVLLLPRSTVEVPAAWSGDPAVDSRPPDAIRAGANGLSQSIAAGDDLQLIPAGIDGLPEDALVITAGENGLLDSVVVPGDVATVVTGFSTSKTCGADTPPTIKAGPNGSAETRRAEGTDDLQLTTGGSVAPDTNVIGPGANGFIDTAAAGDDVFVGPGIPCDDDTDCPGGTCDGQEVLYRYKDREYGEFRRFWAVLIGDDTQLGADFNELVLRPGDIVTLGFVQDQDRDGIIGRQEFLFGSSDRRQDTDSDRLDDFSEIKVGWEIQTAGSPIRRVFPDPRLRDSDFDGLSDFEEQDFRRAQCECVSDTDPTDRTGPCVESDVEPPCPTDYSCLNVADRDIPGAPVDCSSDVTGSRTDPRSTDTDQDGVGDGGEVRGFQTGAAIVDPRDMVLAGDDRDADTTACPQDKCIGGGIDDGKPCRLESDCGPIMRCSGGADDGDPCDSDIDCSSDPRNPGLCEQVDSTAVECQHMVAMGEDVCDDVQVVKVGTRGLHTRTVVVAPGHDGILHSTTLAALSAGDRRVTTSTATSNRDLRASSSALGDDEQIAPVSTTEALPDTFLGRTIVRRGFDGIFQTSPAGDDALALGQRLQTANPLDPDTDADLISDGLEQLLGGDPRNPGDGSTPNDSDGDGLYDSVEESTGWNVTVNGGTPRKVYSNPQVADSDLDGVPDFAERQLGLDPTSADTDGDGLDDHDELSEEQFILLSRFNGLFPVYFIDSSTSDLVGSNPLLCDTDGDKLPDGFEVRTGWSVRVVTASGVITRQVFPDPLLADSDFDGLSDAGEFRHGGATTLPTDPTDADTDDDNRMDGGECPTALAPAVADCSVPTSSFATCSSNPLEDDLTVTVRYATLVITNGPDDGANEKIDLFWDLWVQRPEDASFPGSNHILATAATCPGEFDEDCGTGQCLVEEGVDIPLFTATQFAPMVVKRNQGFLIHGAVNESDVDCAANKCQGGSSDGEDCDDVSDCPGTNTACAPEISLSCHLTFFRSYSYETLQPGFRTEVITLSDATGDAECQFDLVIEIQVQ